MMRHHVIYWSMAKRETDVDDIELDVLRRREHLGEVYIEFLDGVRQPLSWDQQGHHWVEAIAEHARREAKPGREAEGETEVATEVEVATSAA